MAKQATAQGIAYQQLRPTEGGNLGAIEEEHIRYWSKFDADEKAKAEALAAQQREYERKIAESQGKKFDDLAKGIALGDSEGYFREQIVKQFESDQSLLYSLAKKASEGDTEARIQLDNKLQFYNEATTLDKTTNTVAQKYIGGRNNPAYNPAVDENDLGFLESLGGSFYTLQNGKVLVRKSLDSDETEEISVQEMSNKLNSMQGFSGKFKPHSFAKEITDGISLYDNNGNKTYNKVKQVQSIQKTKEMFLLDPLALKSWAYEKGYRGDKLDNLSEFDVLDLSRQFVESQVKPAIQESARRAPERTEAPAKPTLELITDTNGKPVNEYEVDGTITTLPEGTAVFRTTEKINNFIDAKGSVITQPVLIKKPNGDFQVRGKSETVITEPVLDDNGNPVPKTQGGIMVPDGEGGYLTETRNRKVYNDITIDDDVSMDIFVRQIENPLTKQNFRNLEEASKYTNQVIPSKTTVPSNQPVKFN